jgi:hypothetical protein
VPKKVPEFGDVAFFVGFLLAAGLYAVLFSLQRGKGPQDAVLVTPDEVVQGTSPGDVTPVG